ncbi:hypothetical protein [Glaciecola sp. 1036]|uniref:hypothetical protein n=1 Tax=Alteromonadaceae TaxID=72275 RepID=UPI003CFF726D
MYKLFVVLIVFGSLVNGLFAAEPVYSNKNVFTKNAVFIEAFNTKAGLTKSHRTRCTGIWISPNVVLAPVECLFLKSDKQQTNKLFLVSSDTGGFKTKLGFNKTATAYSAAANAVLVPKHLKPYVESVKKGEPLHDAQSLKDPFIFLYFHQGHKLALKDKDLPLVPVLNMDKGIATENLNKFMDFYTVRNYSDEDNFDDHQLQLQSACKVDVVGNNKFYGKANCQFPEENREGSFVTSNTFGSPRLVGMIGRSSVFNEDDGSRSPVVSFFSPDFKRLIDIFQQEGELASNSELDGQFDISVLGRVYFTRFINTCHAYFYHVILLEQLPDDKLMQPTERKQLWMGSYEFFFTGAEERELRYVILDPKGGAAFGGEPTMVELKNGNQKSYKSLDLGIQKDSKGTQMQGVTNLIFGCQLTKG